MDASDLSFVSVKAIDIGEVHRFSELAGRITDRGKAVVTINLSSVDTAIPLRDERMRELLFETDEFTHATIRATIDKNTLETIEPGSTQRLDTMFALDLHGSEIELTGTVLIAKLDADTVTVTSTEPLLVNAGSVGLADGIEALRKVANLPSISATVPVSFLLTFNRE